MSPSCITRFALFCPRVYFVQNHAETGTPVSNLYKSEEPVNKAVFIYLMSAALISRRLAALLVEEVGLLGGVCVEFWNLPSMEPEIWGAPEHGELISEGQIVLILLLRYGSSSAQQLGTSLQDVLTPSLDGKLADVLLQGVEGKID